MRAATSCRLQTRRAPLQCGHAIARNQGLEPGPDLTELATGLVRVSYGSHGVVRLEPGTDLPCQYRRQVGRPYCGDRVEVRMLDNGDGVVERILPRSNRFMRGDARQRKHVVAANVDQVAIVLARKPLPSRDLLERYLVAVHSLDIRPLIVLNKTDILEYDRSQPGAAVFDRISDYRQLGYSVIETSCKTKGGTAELEPGLAEATSILVGQSGVGKSSLVRRLLPDIDVQTGALSDATGKGTHTTTTTMLYTLPSGGYLIDSPGVWEFGLWKLEPIELQNGFIEFRPFLGHCRFNDCRHLSEPGCAIKQAVGESEILDWRYAAYCRLLEQNRD